LASDVQDFPAITPDFDACVADVNLPKPGIETSEPAFSSDAI